jgi:hypothetical protein
VVDAQALVLEERDTAVVPPRVELLVTVVLAEQVVEPEAEHLGEGFALGRRAVDLILPLLR